MITNIKIKHFQISPNDKLSQWVCIKCENEIKRSHEFRNQCLEAFKVLSETNSQCFDYVQPKLEPLEYDNIEIKIEPNISDNDEENWSSINIEPENLSQPIEYSERITEIPIDYRIIKIM